MRRRHGHSHDHEAAGEERQDAAPGQGATPAGAGQEGPTAAQDDPAAADGSRSPNKLENIIKDLEDKYQEERNERLRAIADFQNFRRRSEEQRKEERQFANRELILGLLPILDNFQRALAAAEQNKSYEALVGGVALTLRQVQDFLKKQGVEPIEAVGKEFDPNFHEAVARVEDSEHPENTVVDELQQGYTMHNRVLRPSMVRVAQKG